MIGKKWKNDFKESRHIATNRTKNGTQNISDASNINQTTLSKNGLLQLGDESCNQSFIALVSFKDSSTWDVESAVESGNKACVHLQPMGVSGS